GSRCRQGPRGRYRRHRAVRRRSRDRQHLLRAHHQRGPQPGRPRRRLPDRHPGLRADGSGGAVRAADRLPHPLHL
ncbi:MAG: ATP synthase F0 sector subunit c, partial [uncultured Craurococcus sp.]